MPRELPVAAVGRGRGAARRAAGHRASGKEAFQRGDWKAALRCYEAGARADPRCVLSALNRSAALLKLGRHRDALLAADRALWLTNGASATAWGVSPVARRLPGGLALRGLRLETVFLG